MNNFKPLLLTLLFSLYATSNAADTWQNSTNFHPPMAPSKLLPPETGDFEEEEDDEDDTDFETDFKDENSDDDDYDDDENSENINYNADDEYETDDEDEENYDIV